jgi:hypothetical protein
MTRIGPPIDPVKFPALFELEESLEELNQQRLRCELGLASGFEPGTFSTLANPKGCPPDLEHDRKAFVDAINEQLHGVMVLPEGCDAVLFSFDSPGGPKG